MEANNKQREALAQIRDMIMTGGFNGRSPAYIVNICDAALAAPPRNCDVGTAEEQSDRFAKFCKMHADGCGLGYGSRGIGHPKVTCPAFKDLECALVWAQMFYEEGGAK